MADHEPAPVLTGRHTFASITDKLGGLVVERRLSSVWLLAMALWSTLVMLLVAAISYLLFRGVGVWGVNIPVAWGFAIANFVWWIGIGHAGTFISAFLLLMRQEWRTSINRFAEAMTLFAVACAGLFPLLHLGRPWTFYFLLPYPDTMQLWPQFRSPLVWDVFAVFTYFAVSLMFWFLGMLPDLASLRDHAPHRWQRLIYGVLAMGWRGSARHWRRYQMTYLILAGLATPLVISVHSVVSLDFAVANLPGWHSTMYPPYFVSGAIFSGFAMVLTLAIPLRAAFGLHDIITERHLNNAGKLALTTGLIVAYCYIIENFIAWYGGNRVEQGYAWFRLTGPYGFLYWIVLACNVGVPQLLWSRRIRTSALGLFIIAFFIQLGMWSERVMIVITSLSHDFMPSAWRLYVPTAWDWATLAGTVGLFFFLFFMFVRTLPVSSASELKELIHRRGSEPS